MGEGVIHSAISLMMLEGADIVQNLDTGPLCLFSLRSRHSYLARAQLPHVAMEAMRGCTLSGILPGVTPYCATNALIGTMGPA